MDSEGLEMLNHFNHKAFKRATKNPTGVLLAVVWVPLLIVTDIVAYPLAVILHILHRGAQKICDRDALVVSEMDTAKIAKVLAKEARRHQKDQKHHKENHELSSQANLSFLRSEDIYRKKPKNIVVTERTVAKHGLRK